MKRGSLPFPELLDSSLVFTQIELRADKHYGCGRRMMGNLGVPLGTYS